MTLEEVAEHLEKAYLASRKRLTKEMPGVEPELVVDANGRSMLLDGLVELSKVKRALRDQDR